LQFLYHRMIAILWFLLPVAVMLVAITL